mmetsp:Transcript_3864/g.8317  ORF Transcript_3864/g.8317 Transcript_3864/m.8317 type:complete len:94 (-) Transcript_3864:177-458(-)
MLRSLLDDDEIDSLFYIKAWKAGDKESLVVLARGSNSSFYWNLQIWEGVKLLLFGVWFYGMGREYDWKRLRMRNLGRASRKPSVIFSICSMEV